MSRTIVAVGGYDIFDEPRDRVFDAWLVARASERAAEQGRERPRICWVGTAGGDSPHYRDGFFTNYAKLDCEVVELELFHRSVEDISAFLLTCDAILVSGGNTANMLAIWRAHRVDHPLRLAWMAGVILSGWSAGMLCWFQAGVTDSFSTAKLAGLEDGLGLLAGSACPHYDAEPLRRPTYARLIADGFPAGLAVDDGAAAVFADTTLSQVVSWRASATAHRVDATGSTALPARSL